MKKYILFLFLLPILSIGQTTQTFSTAGTSSFVVPNGVTSLDVQAWGGGGGGGGTTSTNAVAAGGGGGGNHIKKAVTVTPGATYFIAVGAGGAAGASGTANTTNAFNGGISGITLAGANQSPLLAALGGAGGGGGQVNPKFGAAGNTSASNAIAYSLTNVGAGYASAPTIVISPTAAGYKPYAASTAYALNDIVSSGNNFYIVTFAGTTAASGAISGSGSLSNGSATFQYLGVIPTAIATMSGGSVSYLTIKQGSGFTSAPIITFSGGTPTTAATATGTLITSSTYTSPLANFIGGTGAVGVFGGVGSTASISGGGGSSAGTASNGNNATSTYIGGGAVTGGGAGASGTNGSTADVAGVAATTLGGGGSGAIQANNGSTIAKIGGAGFSGQVIITYTCTSYDVLTAAASASQFSSGAPSTMTLTSSSLPAGTYTVTYSTTNPATSGNTASMTFSGTTGTFLTMNLAANSDITVTSLQSGSGAGCSSTITTNNTATAVLAAVVVTAGAIGTNQTICSGSTPATLTSATTGTVSSGTLSYEWQTNASGSYVTISGENLSTYAPPALTATTSYQRRTVADNGGTKTYSGYTSAVIITVNNITTVGTIGITSSSICNGANAVMTSTVDGSGAGSISYEWQMSVNGGSTYTPVSGVITANYTATALTTTTMFQRRTVSTLNGVACYSAYTSPLTITVSTIVINPGTIGTAQSICTGNAPATLTSVLDGSASDGGATTYQWQTNASGGYLDIPSATGATYPPPSLTASTNYRRRTIYTATGCTVNSNVIGITVNANISAVVVTPNTAQNVCQAVGGSQLTVAITDGGAFTRQWGKRSVSNGAITNVSGANGANFTPTSSNVGAGSWFIVCTVTPTCGSPTISNEVSVTLNPTPTITTVSQAATICEGSVATINLAGLVASSTATVTYTINGGSTVTLTGLVADASGAASFTTAALTPANNGQVLQITGITITSATPNCTFVPTSKTVTLAVNANLSAVTVTEPVTSFTSQTICSGTADWKSLSVAVTAGIGTPVRQWGKRSVTGGAITDIVGQTGTSFTPSTFYLGVGNWLVVCTVTPSCGSAMVSNEYPVTINPTATLTGASQAATVCEGSVATINLAGLLASSTATVSYTINGAAQTPISVVADASGAASFTTTALTAANNGQTLQITGITITSATPNCTAVFTQNVTLSVTAAISVVAITPNTAQNVCQAIGGNQLTVAVTDGGSFTRLWGKRSVTNGTITSLGATGATLTPTAGNVGVGSWFIVCTVTPACGSPTISNEVAVTINPTPTLTGAAQAAAVCEGSVATINLTGLVASSTATVTYTINGGSTVTLTGLVADAAGTASFTTAALTAANNGQTLQITSITITSATPNCTAAFTQNVTLSVTAAVSAVSITPNTNQNVCQAVGGNQLTVLVTGGGAYTRLWGKRSVTNGTITSLAATGSTYTPTANNLGVGSWFVVCTVTPTCGSATVSNEVAVTINPTPTLTGAAQAAAVCEGSVATINLTGLVASSTATVTYTINGGSTVTLTGLVADAAGTASFTTAALTAANNGQTLQITGITITSATPNCTATFTQNVTLSVSSNLSAVVVTPNTNQTFCQVSSGTQLSVGVTGGGTYTRLWGKRTSTGGLITDLAANGATFTPSANNLGQGSWFVVCTVTPTCGSPMVSNEVAVTINPTPTLTGAAQAAAICDGSGATINLTGLVASSTATVTYTINGGSTITLTGLVADTSGAASFTTAALTPANNGQILQITGVTITSAAPNCTLVPTNRNVTLVVNANLSAVAVTPTTAQSICATASGSVLTVAETGGGTVTRQWGKRSTTGGAITDIVGQTATTYTPTGASLGAGSWLVVCRTTPPCGSSIISNEVSVTVSASLTLTGASQAVSTCSGSAAVINLTGLVPSTTSTITYQIAGGTTRTVTGVVADASGNANFTTITTLTGANNGQTLQITGITIPSASPVCTTVFAQNVTLSVIAPTIGSYSQSTAVCAGSSATILLTGLLPNTTSTISYTLSGTAQPDVTGVVSDASGNASFSIVATNAQNFRITAITSTSTTPNCTTTIGSSGAFNLSVPTITAGSIGTAQTVCSGSAPAPLTSVADGTGTGTITYEWQADDGTGYVTISGAVASTYSPPALTTTTSYKRRTLSLLSGQTCYSAYTTAITMTVNTLTAGSIGGATTICSENSRNIFQLTAGTTSIGSAAKSYEWQANDGTGWVTIPGEIGTSYQTPVLTITTSYQRRTVAVSNGVTCYSDYTTPVTITINSVNAGLIGTKQSICAGDTPAPLTSITPGTGAGTITYQWQSRILPAVFADIPGETGPTYSPGVTTQQTTFRRRVLSTLNGVTCVSSYVAVTIRVNDPDEGIIGTNQTICAGSTPATLTSIEAGVAPGVITYEWQADNGSGYATIAGATSATYTPPALNVTTSYQRRTLGVCAGLPTASPWTTVVTITVNAVTAGTIGSNQTFCTAATPATLTSTTAGAGSGTISYEWQTNASGSYITISGATSATYSPPAVAATTSYRRRTISILNSVTCTSAYTTPVTITIDSNPVAPTISGTTNATCVPFTGSVTLAGLPATGTWTINPGGITGTGTNYTITGLSSGNYTFTVTNSNGCVSNATSTATVASVVINTWNGTAWSNGSTSNQQSLIFNSDYPPAVDPNVDLYGCSCTVNTGKNVTIKTGRSLIITDQVTVLGTGTLTFENTASLVQINDVTNSGNINYKRNTTPINKFDYNYWSTPVLPFTLGGISPNTNGEKFYSFDPSVNNWKQESSATSMAAGSGYIIRGPQSFDDSSRSTYEAVFNGVPINGNVSISGVVPDASYLLGNPYPSALDADSFLNANQNVLDGTLYFWTHNTPIAVNTPNPGSGAFAYSGDDYASYNQTGGTAAAPSSNSGGINSNIPSGKIAAGQGFFGGTKTVAAGFASSTPIVYTNAMRVGVGGITGNNTQFFKTKTPATKSATVVEKHRVWLNLTNNQGAFKQTLVGYITGATNDYESRFDGKSYDGNEFLDFYSVLQNKNFSIQGRGLPFDESDEIPLGYRVAVDGTFSIGIDQKDGFLSKQSIFIEDKLTNSVYNLNEGKYTFTTAKGTFDNRFVLKYNYKTLGVKETELSKGIAVLFSNNNRTLFIRNNLKDATVTTATLFNIAGQKIANWDVKGKEQTNIQIAIKNVPSAIYIVKLTTSKGELSKKIIIK